MFLPGCLVIATKKRLALYFAKNGVLSIWVSDVLVVEDLFNQ